jgi:hypothetical protein
MAIRSTRYLAVLCFGWPEMRSWQTPEGMPDGRPNPLLWQFIPAAKPFVIPRGEWISVEFMLIMNTSPEASDGEVALWIDGEQVVHFAPGIPRKDTGEMTVSVMILAMPDAVPFEGFRWRHDMDVKINVLRLQHYISGSSFNRTQAYSDNNPDSLSIRNKPQSGLIMW